MRVRDYAEEEQPPERILRRITIGITDRGDVPRQIDQALVAFGTGCEVVVLRHAREIAGVNALFIPGGMYDLPDTRGEDVGERPHEPRNEQARVEWLHRVQLQRDLVTAARINNIPVLGVCGGSRSIAQVVPTGFTQHLTAQQRDTHNHDFARPWNVSHNVTISGRTMLGRIARGGHYRRDIHDVPNTETTVNSMHWASSGFDDMNQVRVSALAPDDVLEGWELRDHPFFMGIQWHPEFAQLPLDDFTNTSDVHANIMSSLGDAAEENSAARIIQNAFRQRQRRRWEQRYGEDAPIEWDVPVNNSVGSFVDGTFVPGQ